MLCGSGLCLEGGRPSVVQVLQAARVLGPRAVEHFLGGPVEPAEARAVWFRVPDGAALGLASA